MRNPQLMSSDESNWETPPSIYNRLNNVFKFSLDAAANTNNHLCPLFIDENQDALQTDWLAFMERFRTPTSTVFLNPPYGKGMLDWMKKVKEEYQKGLTIVCLVPARTETKWHQIAWDYARYFLFITSRLKFLLNGVPAKRNATFPSEIIVFSDRKWNLLPLRNMGQLFEQNVITNAELKQVI